MKKTSTFFLAIFTIATSILQAQGIQFEKGNWDDILAMAHQEDKLIFVDAYTTWCGPCKKMSKEVFTQKKVGQYYNEKFINVKLDMEKGEGPKVAQQYQVMVYPTLLFIDSNGDLVHRAAGYQNADQFVALGDIALDPSRRISSMQIRYDRGDRDPAFLKKYAQVSLESYDGKHEAIAISYLETQDDWSTEANRAFLLEYINGTDTKLFDYLVDNQASFYELVGEEAVKGRIQELIYNSLSSEETPSLEKVDALYARAYPPKEAKKLSAQYRPIFYRQQGDRENYAKSTVAYFKAFPSNDAEELNEAAWTFYRVIEDKKMLKFATKWAKKAVKIDDNFYHNDTLAALYFKRGKKKKTKKVALKAIEQAKVIGEDYSHTQELLEQL